MILNKHQKVSLLFLSIFSFLIIGMWTAQFNQRIKSPFERKTASKKNIPTSDSFVSQDSDYNEALTRTKDTDGDGLSNWDELYVYKTSPYIEDSDSDGYTDGQEIQLKTDPNCPSDKDCAGSLYVDASKQQAQFAPIVPQLNGINNEALQLLQQEQEQMLNIDIANINNLDDAGLQNILSGNSDADTLRAMLMSAGIDPNMLNQLSDDDLMSAYQETLEQ